jgi:hypothetical protein
LLLGEGKAKAEDVEAEVGVRSTQKAITTEAKNVLGEKFRLRQCSEPSKAAADIYERLNYKKMPFRKIKICSTQ